MAGRRILRACPVVLVVLAFSSLAVASTTELPPTTSPATAQPDQEGTTEEPTTPSPASAEDEAQVEPGCTWQGQHYNVGDRWVSGPPDNCLRYLCIEDGGFSAFTCPEFIPAPGCTEVPGNMSAVFPHCCPDSSCAAADKEQE